MGPSVSPWYAAAAAGAEDASTTMIASGTPPTPAATADLDLIYGRASIPQLGYHNFDMTK
jgi:hypothetical protein